MKTLKFSSYLICNSHTLFSSWVVARFWSNQFNNEDSSTFVMEAQSISLHFYHLCLYDGLGWRNGQGTEWWRASPESHGWYQLVDEPRTWTCTDVPTFFGQDCICCGGHQDSLSPGNLKQLIGTTARRRAARAVISQHPDCWGVMNRLLRAWGPSVPVIDTSCLLCPQPFICHLPHSWWQPPTLPNSLLSLSLLYYWVI